MKLPLDSGFYASAQAARLVGIAPRRLLRWVRGRETPSWIKHRGTPVLRRDLPDIHKKVALSFLDLVEIRMVKAFLDHGVEMRIIKAAAETAVRIAGSAHPFCLERFETDGRTVFARIEKQHARHLPPEERSRLLDLATDQFAIGRVINPLLKQIDYIDGVSAKWWPRGRRAGVVIDPRISMGAPVVASCGIPTEILAAAVRAEGSVARAADWYCVSQAAVRKAVEFERKLAAA